MKPDCIFTPKSTAILKCSCNYKKKSDSWQLFPFDYFTLCAKTKCERSQKVSSLTDNVKINQAKGSRLSKSSVASFHLMWERSGSVVRALHSRPRGCWFEPHRLHCIVSLGKNINPSLVLVQSRKTRPFIIERLLLGRKESKQTNIPPDILMCGSRGGGSGPHPSP